MMSEELKSQRFLKAVVLVAALLLGIGLWATLAVVLVQKYGWWPP